MILDIPALETSVNDKTVPIFRTWAERIDSGRFTMAWCRQWCSAIVPLSESLPPHGKRTNLRDWEARILRDEFRQRWSEAGGIMLDPKDNERGLLWLQRYGHQTLGIPEAAIVDFDHFSFVGEARHVNRSYLPIWRINTMDHGAFEYFRVPWQSQCWDGTGEIGGWWKVTP